MSETPGLIPVTKTTAGKEHECGCGHEDSGSPVIDARTIPHRLRHAAIIGAASSLNPGEAMEVVAPHVPTPLLDQIDQLPGYTFEHTLLEASEGFARVQVLRQA